MPATPETFEFLSQDDDPAGFAGYRELYAGGSDVDHAGGSFGARVVAHRFERLLLFDRLLDGVVHTRGPARVRRDGFDHLNVQLLVAGAMWGGRPGDERALSPGEMIVFDTTQPQRTRQRRARTLTFSLSREVLDRVHPVTRALHGAILPVAAASLLADFGTSLARRSGQLAPGAAAPVSTVAAHLLAAALGQERAPLRHDAVLEHAALRRLERAQAYVEQRLCDAALNAASAAEDLGMSRSTLDRAFRSYGGFGHYLLGRRLDRMRAALRRKGEVRTVGELAYAHGFTSESHCSRAFRDRYGMPPGEFRAQVRRRGPSRESMQGQPGALDHLFTEVL